MLVVFGLSRADCGFEIVVIEAGIQDFVPGVFQERRFDAANDAVPTVEKEDSHRPIVTSCSSGTKLIE